MRFSIGTAVALALAAVSSPGCSSNPSSGGGVGTGGATAAGGGGLGGGSTSAVVGSGGTLAGSGGGPGGSTGVPDGLLDPDTTTAWNPGILVDTAMNQPLGADGLPVRTTICHTE